MTLDKNLLPCDRQALEEVHRSLLILTDEIADLARYHCLLVAASADQDQLSPERLWEDARTLLNIYLNILDRERIESFVDAVAEARLQLKNVLSEAESLKRLL